MAVKRLFDVVAAAAGLLLLWPLLALIAAAVKRISPGPAFFSQARCGLKGRRFTIYKFRTMLPGAEDMKSEVAHLDQVSGPAFKPLRDPRVTRIGRFLRRFSLDELPQLWNVLKGDMSIVGPRPLPVDEADACTPDQRRRMAMHPGLVCLWQVSGRSLITQFDKWVRLDLEYIDTWSLRLDLEILVRAIPVVITGRGAR